MKRRPFPRWVTWCGISTATTRARRAMGARRYQKEEKTSHLSPVFPQNPQSLNLYSDVGNNPLSRVDNDGHFWEELGNWFKWGHYVNNAGLENALKSDADAARKNLLGYKNMLFD